MQEYPANGFCLFLKKETFKTRVPQSSPANCLKKKKKKKPTLTLKTHQSTSSMFQQGWLKTRRMEQKRFDRDLT